MSKVTTEQLSEEDMILDSNARPILRNLQVGASSAFAFGSDSTEESEEVGLLDGGTDEQDHVISDHLEFAQDIEAPAEVLEAPAEALEAPAEVLEAPAEVLEAPAEVLEAPADNLATSAENLEAPAVVNNRPIVTIQLENGKVIKCNDKDLTVNEWIHCNTALEQDGNDAYGNQGGQGWSKPTTPPTTASPITPSPTTASPTTASPTPKPTTLSPITPSPTLTASITEAPSYHPTERGEPWVLQGTIYYDKNANGKRDSNVDTLDFGKDVEYTWGLGGVQIQLMECDPDTNEGLGSAELSKNYENGENNYHTTVSTGYDVLMHPKLVDKNEEGGKYNLINIMINRAYYIYVTAPEGFLFSGGVCNDEVKGWECNYSSASKFASGYGDGRRTRRNLLRDGSGKTLQLEGPLSNRNEPEHDRILNEAKAVPHKTPSKKELELGIREGRSTKCVSVDRTGMPSSRLDLGVMRIGDVFFEDTDVEMNLDLIKPEIEVRRELQDSKERSLMEVIQERVMERLGRDLESMPLVLKDGMWVYELEREEEEAIGIVTSEVLASNLDKSLLKKGVVLDSVTHRNVIFFAPPPEEDDAKNSTASADSDGINAATDLPEVTAETKENMSSAAARDAFSSGQLDTKPNRRGGQLAVNLLVRGHYNTDLKVDFDYIVQDSINRDTSSIRRQLTFYNVNCRDQTTKVIDLGFTLDDFLEIHTNKGAKLPPQRLKRQQAGDIDDIDEQAFSSACNQKRVLPDYFVESLGGLEISAKTKGVGRTYGVDDGGRSPWAILGGIVAGAFFILCFAFFMFQHGLKKKRQQQKAQKAEVTHIISCDESISDSMKKRDLMEKRKSMHGPVHVGGETATPDDMVAVAPNNTQRRGIFGFVRREITNMTAALASEQRRLGGGSETADLEATLQNNLSDRSDNERSGVLHIGTDSRAVSTGEENPAHVALDHLLANNDHQGLVESTEKNDANMEAGSLEKSITSRNAVPTIIKVDFSSSDESSSSSSSSEDESSSDDDSSSSSSEESESFSRERARRQRLDKSQTSRNSSKMKPGKGKSKKSAKRKANSTKGKSTRRSSISDLKRSSTNEITATDNSLHSSMPEINSREQRHRSSAKHRRSTTNGVVSKRSSKKRSSTNGTASKRDSNRDRSPQGLDIV